MVTTIQQIQDQHAQCTAPSHVLGLHTTPSTKRREEHAWTKSMHQCPSQPTGLTADTPATSSMLRQPKQTM